MATQEPESFNGLHHLKLPAASIQKSLEFYTKIFPFKHIPQFDHLTPDGKPFAKIVTHEPTKLLLELRYAPDQATAQKSWDPITWAVDTRSDLEEWGKWLDAHGIERSPILTSIKSWVMACVDPDLRHVRIYVTGEEHEWTKTPGQRSVLVGEYGGGSSCIGG